MASAHGNTIVNSHFCPIAMLVTKQAGKEEASEKGKGFVQASSDLVENDDDQEIEGGGGARDGEPDERLGI